MQIPIRRNIYLEDNLLDCDMCTSDKNKKIEKFEIKTCDVSIGNLSMLITFIITIFIIISIREYKR